MIKSAASALKKTGLRADVSKQAATAIIQKSPDSQSGTRLEHVKKSHSAPTLTASVKSGNIASGVGIRATYKRNLSTGFAETKVRESWSKSPSGTIELSVPIIKTERTSVEVSSKLEKERNKKPNAALEIKTQVMFD